LFLAVHPKVPAKTFDELVALARSQPGRLNYATPGAGSTHHLCMEYLKSALKIDMTHVPFKGASPAMAALVAGEVDMTLAALPSLQAMAQSGRVRLLAVNSLNRYARMPDLPAISETIPGFEFASSMGLVAARGVPRTALASLSAAATRAAKSPAVVDAFSAMGIEAIGAEMGEYARAIASEDERIGRAVRVANLKLD
jgi:tripartite-type tricarboxylate transporter receptor subunit TctC